MAQQTSVEFLKDRLESILELYNSEWDKVYQAIEQAKAMEKEQIIKARQDGLDNGFSNGSWDSNLYYNENYNK
jgi:hypothetical protein